MSCPACDDPDGGHIHRCERSGTYLAAEAHDGGQVDDAVPVLLFDVHLRFGVAAADERQARQTMTDLVAVLLNHDLVSETEFTIVEREKVGA